MQKRGNVLKQGFKRFVLNTAMKLIEAKYSSDKQVVIVDDLPFADIIERYPPFIDHVSGVLVLSSDLIDPDVYKYGPRNFESERYQTRKKIYPWQAELAGTKRQIKNFLEIHFPEWNGKTKLSTVWKMEDVERAAQAAVAKGDKNMQGDPIREQFTKILDMRKPINEVKYYRAKSASDVYDQMDKVLDYTLFVGNSNVEIANYGLGDINHGDPNSPEVATVYLIVSNQETEEGSIQKARTFLRKKDILYHDIKSEETGVENQWYVVAEYVDPINEASYAYKKPTAAEVVNRYIDFIQEHQPQVKFGDIIVSEHDFTNTGDKEFAALYLWVLHSSFTEARQKVESFAKHFNLPYTSIDTDLHGTGSAYGDRNAYHRPEIHKRIFATLWYGSEPASELVEAAYDGTRKQMFFAVDETGGPMNHVIGPFSSSDETRKFTTYMEKKYGEWVTFNWEIIGHTFPDNYEIDIKSHYDWMTDNV